MKPYLPLLILFISCTKQVEKPIQLVKSITYQIHRYDIKHNLISVDTSIHWCRVSGDELKRFQAVTRTDELICDGTGLNRLVLVIGKPCPVDCKTNLTISP